MTLWLIRFILFTLVMTKEEVNKLHEELNELSAFEEWNLERMVEIAKILKDFYMPNKNKTWEWCNVRDAENPLKKGTVDKDTVSDVET